MWRVSPWSVSGPASGTPRALCATTYSPLASPYETRMVARGEANDNRHTATRAPTDRWSTLSVQSDGGENRTAPPSACPASWRSPISGTWWSGEGDEEAPGGIAVAVIGMGTPEDDVPLPACDFLPALVVIGVVGRRRPLEPLRP